MWKKLWKELSVGLTSFSDITSRRTNQIGKGVYKILHVYIETIGLWVVMISKCNKVESQLRADAISTIGLGGGGLSYDRGGDQSVWPNLFLTPKSDHFKLWLHESSK